MSFNGKWKQTGGENRQEILKYMGVPDDLMKKLAATEATLEITQQGEGCYDEIFTQGEQVKKHTLRIGASCKYGTWDGQSQLDVTPTELTGGRKGFRIEYEYKGVNYVGERELVSPTQLVATVILDGGKVTGKFVYTKC